MREQFEHLEDLGLWSARLTSGPRRSAPTWAARWKALWRQDAT